MKAISKRVSLELPNHKVVGPKKVLFWKTDWLSPSETFIRNQQDSLCEWVAECVGLKKVLSTTARDSDVVLFDAKLRGTIAARLFFLFGYSFRVDSYVRKAGPRVIHAHFAGEGMRIRRIAVRNRIPLVVTLHGRDITAAPEMPGLRGWRYRTRLKRLFRDATLIIAVSKHIEMKALSAGAPADKLVVHYMGIPQQPMRDVAITSGQTFVAVGRLMPKKGFDQLIIAFGMVLQEYPNARLVILGDGPELSRLERMASAHGESIHFAGFQPHDVVIATVGRALAVCIPSVKAIDGDEEGLPTIAMEAGSLGVPVVGYAHSGIPEAIIHEHTGLLVREGDVTGLSISMLRLLRNPVLARELGSAAMVHIARTFSVNEQTKRLEALYLSASAEIRPASD